MDGSGAGSKPASVIVGKVGPASPVSGVDQEIWSPNTPIVGDLEINHPQVGRLKVAIGIFVFSMLMNWGYHFWSGWYFQMWIEGGGGSWDDDFSMLYWIEDSALAWDGGAGFLEMLFIFERVSFWGDLPGFTGLIFIVILMRELMPLVFTGMFVYCWVKRDKDPDLFEKIAIFNGVYFGILAVFLIYIYIISSNFWGLDNPALGIWDSVGFWLAGFAGMVVHPRAIPMPAWVESSRDSLPTRSVGNVYANEVAVVGGTSNSSLILYYLPILAFWFSFWSLWNGGDDDIMGWGAAISIAGFLVSIAVHRWEVVKGFALNIGFSIIIAFIFWFLFSTDVGEDFFDDSGDGFIFWLVFLSAIMPVRSHLKNKHLRALGSVYAMPICLFIIMFGIILAVW